MVYGGTSGKDPFGKGAEGSQEWEPPKEIVGGAKAVQQQADLKPVAKAYVDDWDAPQEGAVVGDDQSYSPRKSETATTQSKSGKIPPPGMRTKRKG